jgi:hypothetical protein
MYMWLAPSDERFSRNGLVHEKAVEQPVAVEPHPARN